RTLSLPLWGTREEYPDFSLPDPLRPVFLAHDPLVHREYGPAPAEGHNGDLWGRNRRQKLPIPACGQAGLHRCRFRRPPGPEVFYFVSALSLPFVHCSFKVTMLNMASSMPMIQNRVAILLSWYPSF